MGKKLNLEYVTEMIGDEYKSWQSGQVVMIEAQTGTGKNRFIQNVLLQFCIDTDRKILYVGNRLNLKRQVKIEVAKLQGITIQADSIDKRQHIGKISIVSYQQLQSAVLDKEYSIDDRILDFNEYNYVVFDECQYILQDASFNNTTVWMENFIRAQRGIVIYMSATLLFIEYTITKLYHPTTEYYFYTTNHDYSYLDPYYYKHDADIVHLINNDNTGKWIYFVNNTNTALKLLNQIEGSKLICSKSNPNKEATKRIATDELENILKNQQFNCKCLIATKVLDNGINLKDNDLVHIVVDTVDGVDFIQMIGRKRIDIKNAESVKLYIPAKSGRVFQGLLKGLNQKMEQVDFWKKDYVGFCRRYDNAIHELDSNIFCRVNPGGEWGVNEIAVKNLDLKIDFCKEMIKAFAEKPQEAYIEKQLDWIMLTYDKSRWLKSEQEIEDIKILENYLKTNCGKRLYSEEQQELSKLIITELITIGKNVNYRTKKLQPGTLEKIIQDELKLPYTVSKTKQENREVNGNVSRRRYIVITPLLSEIEE